MKNIRTFVTLFSLMASAVAANAQTAFQAKFHLTSETRWGRAVLPAGDYRLIMNSVQSPIIIQAEDGKASAMAVAETTVDAAAGGSYIFITRSGAARTVRSMNLPQLHRSLLFKPLTARERETLSARASEIVPVQMAKK